MPVRRNWELLRGRENLEKWSICPGFGARRAGVDAFLVPAGSNARDARKYAQGLRIIPVKSFQQALHALATLPPAS